MRVDIKEQETILLESFDSLYEEFSKYKENLSILIGKMLYINIDTALQLWERLIKRYPNILKTKYKYNSSLLVRNDVYYLTEEIFHKIIECDKSIIDNYLFNYSRYKFLKSNLFEVSGCIGAYIIHAIRYMLEDKCFNEAEEALQMIERNENNKTSLYVILNELLGYQVEDIATYYFYRNWIKKLSNKKEKAVLNIKLINSMPNDTKYYIQGKSTVQIERLLYSRNLNPNDVIYKNSPNYDKYLDLLIYNFDKLLWYAPKYIDKMVDIVIKLFDINISEAERAWEILLRFNQKILEKPCFYFNGEIDDCNYLVYYLTNKVIDNFKANNYPIIFDVIKSNRFIRRCLFEISGCIDLPVIGIICSAIDYGFFELANEYIALLEKNVNMMTSRITIIEIIIANSGIDEVAYDFIKELIDNFLISDDKDNLNKLLESRLEFEKCSYDFLYMHWS